MVAWIEGSMANPLARQQQNRQPRARMSNHQKTPAHASALLPSVIQERIQARYARHEERVTTVGGMVDERGQTRVANRVVQMVFVVGREKGW